mmetsp:Transcript_51411/g.116577  ORF Transcript_51411/g.116577 Transcript_51411/m.116577 type:complete len:200 (-) Transcript_51411:532-1131(-)
MSPEPSIRRNTAATAEASARRPGLSASLCSVKRPGRGAPGVPRSKAQQCSKKALPAFPRIVTQPVFPSRLALHLTRGTFTDSSFLSNSIASSISPLEMRRTVLLSATEWPSVITASFIQTKIALRGVKKTVPWSLRSVVQPSTASVTARQRTRLRRVSSSISGGSRASRTSPACNRRRSFDLTLFPSLSTPSFLTKYAT